jgi:hypothetical protein
MIPFACLGTIHFKATQHEKIAKVAFNDSMFRLTEFPQVPQSAFSILCI